MQQLSGARQETLTLDPSASSIFQVYNTPAVKRSVAITHCQGVGESLEAPPEQAGVVVYGSILMYFMFVRRINSVL